MKIHAALLGLLLMLPLGSPWAFPRPLFETEPNDIPSQAQSFRGEARVVGSAVGRDVDHFWWVFDDEESARFWTLELRADRADTGIRLRLSWPGEAESDVFEFGAEPTGAAETLLLELSMAPGAVEAVSRQLMFPAGEHLITVEADGPGGGYELILRRTDPVRIDRTLAPGEAPTGRPAGERWSILQIADSSLSLPLMPEGGEGRRWQLEVLGELGAALAVQLDGVPAADAAAGVDPWPGSRRWSQLALQASSQVHFERADEQPLGRIGLRLMDDGPLERVGAADEDAADEPIWLDADQDLSLNLEAGQRRTLAFELDDDLAQGAFNIEVAGSAGVQVCLIERHVASPHCTRGALAQEYSVCEPAHRGARDPVCRSSGPAPLFADASLAPGSYELRLHNPDRRESRSLEVRVQPTAAPPAGRAVEPNDHPHWASPLPAGQTLSGRLDGARSAHFDILVPAEPPYWKIVAEGDHLTALRLARPVAVRDWIARAESAAGTTRLAHAPLYLPPGRYRVELSGEDSDYRIALNPADPPPPGSEREPNDEPRLANPVLPGQTVRGAFHSPADQDWFHFHLPGWNRLNLHLEPPADGDLRLRLYWGDEALIQTTALDASSRLSAVLPAGDYSLRLDGPSPSTGPYAVELSLDQPWHHTGVPHPVPFRRYPGPLPKGGEIHREVNGVAHDTGYFELPVAEVERVVTVHHWPGVIEARFSSADGESLDCVSAASNRVCELSVPAGRRVLVETTQTVRARRAIVIEDPFQPSPAEPEVALDLSSPALELAAELGFRQRLPLRLEVRAEGFRGRLPLKAHLSHDDARLEGLPDWLEISDDQPLSMDLSVDVPPVLDSALPLSLFVGAGSQHARLDWPIDAAAEPVGSHRADGPPEQLRGLVNLAWNALGAVFVEPDTGAPAPLRVRVRAVDHYVGLDQLIDDLATLGSYLRWGHEMGEPLPLLRLGLGGGLVHALSFNNRSGHGLPARWSTVRIEFADADRQFGPPLMFELDPHDGEQIFELDEPVQASYVRITPLRSWGAGQPTGIGLLRVLGEPADPGAPADVLSPQRGGHVVWTRPPLNRELRSYTAFDRLPDLLSDVGPLPIRGTVQTLVYGMNQNRAARLSGLGWVERDDPGGQAVERVHVSTSVSSPVGPWESQGEWLLERDAEGRARLDFDQPLWARYLRLDLQLPDAQAEDQPSAWNLPAAVSAWESADLSSGESILAWWGHDRISGPYEQIVAPPQPFWPVDDDRSTPDVPIALNGRHSAGLTGHLSEPGDARSYRIDLAEGENSLFASVAEDQSGRIELRLLDPQGEAVDARIQRPEHGRVELEAIGLEPGRYRLDVIHRPRNIVFIWDGSGSIAEHQPVIYQALSRFAEGLAPGHERANLLALGGPLLIRDWAERPEQIRRTLAEYDNRYVGSDSEPALALAARAIDREPGEGVIFLITDAELVSRDLAAWEALADARPRIFALEINHGQDHGSHAHRHLQQLMQNWAMVGGGQYHYTADRSGLIRAFEAGMRQIRQPGRFRLEIETTYRDPPQPGSLQIVSGDEPAVGGGVVHLIFDASGSMLRRMEGGRRIDVAKQIAADILDERIPASVPVALRAYGHTEPHSCATELLVPPRTGNHDQVRTAIDRLQAINLARTPLAASIDAVLEDLEGFTEQNRLVVLLTDGEETCDGDLEAAVQRLVAAGVNIRLNIVGFHIDELDLQGEFERFAGLGGGEYFDSQDGEELIQGLRQALAASFSILDVSGQVLAQGKVDGEPISLVPGEYQLLLHDQRGEHRRNLKIQPAEQKSLDVTVDFQ